jgi:hypothetical protein
MKVSDPKWDSKTFFDFLWKIMTTMSIERAERDALVETLSRTGVLPPELYQTIRSEKLRAAAETIQRISQGDESAWLAVLREFEGPAQ